MSPAPTSLLGGDHAVLRTEDPRILWSLGTGTCEAVALVGGLAYNPCFVRCLRENLEVAELKITEGPEFVDALGAAVIAAERAA